MSALGSLKPVSVVRINLMPRIQIRRNKLSAKLVDQIALARAMKEGTTDASKRVHSVKC
jgi:hypothetical protein